MSQSRSILLHTKRWCWSVALFCVFKFRSSFIWEWFSVSVAACIPCRILYHSSMRNLLQNDKLINPNRRKSGQNIFLVNFDNYTCPKISPKYALFSIVLFIIVFMFPSSIFLSDDTLSGSNIYLMLAKCQLSETIVKRK